MIPALILLIEDRILMDWSPEQLSGSLKAELGILITQERIYQHIWADKHYGGTLYMHFRQCKKNRKKYKRGQIRNRVSIDERPAIIAEKNRISDWEIDSVIGQNHKSALETIMDRVSKLILIKKVARKQAEVVTAATISLLQPYLDKTLTITADNGKRFAGHEKIKAHLNADVYLAHPYHFLMMI